MKKEKDIGPIVCVFLIIVGMVLLVTGVGGGRYSFTTGQWYWGERSTPTGTRIVGAIMIAFALLLWRMKPK